MTTIPRAAQAIVPSLVAFAIASAAVASPDASSPSRGRGLYVWGEGIAMTDGRGEHDAQARRRLLDFCASMRVLRLYLAADSSSWSGPDLAELLDGAAARGIVVYAVPPGNLQDTWARPFPTRKRCDHGAVLRWVDAVLRFNGTADHPFLGIMLDVEPHQAKGRGWFGLRRKAWREDPAEGLSNLQARLLAAQYLEMLSQVREHLEGRLVFGATIPAWYAAPAFRIEHGGRADVLAAHVARAVDFVSVMNYTDGEGREMTRRVAEAVDRLLSFGSVESLFETAKPRRNGGPGESETLYRSGQSRFVEIEAMLERRFGQDGRYVGSALHHYRSAAGAGTRRWPNPSRQ